MRKNIEPYACDETRNETWAYSHAWLARNNIARPAVKDNHRIVAVRSPRSPARTATCIVRLDNTNTTVAAPVRWVARWTPAGGPGMVATRHRKYAAKSPLKNISCD